MKILKWMVAGIAVGVMMVAFRDVQNRTWLPFAFPRGEAPTDEEPILGYDGMDQETLLEWITAANLDSHILRSIVRYERTHLGREPVLETVEEMIG